ncbi:hypothetical protein [Streptomyces tanashiensis]|uniref:Uncharacterized protein n=1 Tax=Streptomyces tanashiensis TaxID=67367 RepID=A0ABY6QZR8_9ACTN|nr:hypothetical protein [Streptomyces tanashiensis]UZX22152.1 hypothetical protein LDH80_16080 [Streptomyces tanashiensis]
MAQSFVPHQPSQPPSPPPGTPPGGVDPRRSPAASEATRLLCAGTYLDDAFRDAVIDQLYVHEERFAAPSLGYDASRVLAHALRARRVELAWAAGILALWIVAIPLTKGLVALLIAPFLLLGIARWVRGRSATAPVYRLVPAFVLRWYGRLMLLQSALFLFLLAFADDEYGEYGEYGGSGGSGGDFLGDVSDTGDFLDLVVGLAAQEVWGVGKLEVWITIAVPFLVAWAVATQRGQFARALTRELSRERFADQRSDPAELAEGGRFRRLRDRIRVEQHARLIMYGSEDPFCGAGAPYEPWSLSVELRPRKNLDGKAPEPLDNSAVLRHVVPLLEALRVPSPHGSPRLQAAVRDRLRELEIDEVVFLPVDGLPARTAAPYTPEAFEAHRSGAIEEGGETRRHFLRVRVGGWGEEIVTTVFVRVHTQGGMLMLEVAPHVLRPVKPLYRYADRNAHRYLHNHHFGRAVWALGRTPRSAGQAVVTLWRALGHLWRVLTAGHTNALPEGPWVSVRELGSDDEASLFQEMDVSRYLKSVQDRVANGVTVALREAGYETAEFEQKIVHVAEGGTFIENTKGNVTLGNHNTVTSKTFTTSTTGGDRG